MKLLALGFKINWDKCVIRLWNLFPGSTVEATYIMGWEVAWRKLLRIIPPVVLKHDSPELTFSSGNPTSYHCWNLHILGKAIFYPCLFSQVVSLHSWDITCEGGRTPATLTFGADPVCLPAQYFLQYSWQFVSRIFLEPSTPPCWVLLCSPWKEDSRGVIFHHNKPPGLILDLVSGRFNLAFLRCIWHKPL